MPILKTVTLGCKVNQYETEYVRQGLLRLGYHEAEKGLPADLCLVNTCTVTAEGDLKSRKAIRQLARENPHSRIVVMGCYATRAAEEVAKLPGVVEVVTDKRQLPQLLSRFGLVDVPSGIDSFGSRHRAYVKVQDGCRMRCTYCIIPSVRPVLASRPVVEVLGEIRRLVDNGYSEIVLTGIHLGHYGVDLGGTDRSRSQLEMLPGANNPAPGQRVDLAGLVARIVAMDGEFRLRISSIEAVEASRELIQLMAEYPDRICPHLHLSMQSGSDRVLERMGRRWASSRFLEKCEAIRRSLDNPALTTDVIVGFPGETEEDFQSTCRVVEEVGFSKIHVFRFSPREGTPAAEMSPQVPDRIQRRRAAGLSELAQRLRRRYFESLIGRRLQVLVESPQRNHPGTFTGTSARYVPVELDCPADQVGRLVAVTAKKIQGGRVHAKE